MYRGRWLIVAGAVLLIVALLVAGNGAAQRDAWMQGYMMGRLSSGTGGGAGADVLPYMYGYGGGGFGPHFGGFGILFFLGFLFLLFAGMRFFRYWMWHEGKGPWGGPGMHGRGPGHRHGRHDWWGDEGAPDGSPEGEMPGGDAETGRA